MIAKKKNIFLLLLILQAMFCMNSCNNDDEELFKPNIGTGDIIGSWYADKTDKESVYRKEYSFNEDGTYSFMAINMPSIMDVSQTQESGTGIYNISGNILRRGQDHKGGQGWLDPVEYKVEGNTLTTLNPYDYSIDTYYRIVDTYEMEVGETREFKYNGESGKPTFESSSHIIASINSYSNSEDVNSILKPGIITARKFGEAYITARYPSGNTVVIKVIVKDGDSETTDFFDELMTSKDHIFGLFGNKYFAGETFNLENQYFYVVGDKQIKFVDFQFDKEDRVWAVGANYWTSCDMQKIKESLDKRFTYEGTRDDGRLVYLLKRDGTNMTCELDTLQHTASWSIQRIGFYACYDYIYFDNVDEMLNFHCNNWILYENDIYVEFGYMQTTLPNNEIFQSIHIYFDNYTRDVNLIELQCYPGYSTEYIENWLKSKYYGGFTYNGYDVYCYRKDYWNMMPQVIMHPITFTNGNAGLAYEKI